MADTYLKLGDNDYLQVPEGTTNEQLTGMVQAYQMQQHQAKPQADLSTRFLGALQALPVGISRTISNTQAGMGKGQTAEQIKALYNPNMDDWERNYQAAVEGGGPLKILAELMGSAGIMGEYAATSGIGRLLAGGLASAVTKNPRAISIATGLGGLAAPVVGTLPSGIGEFKHAVSQLGGIDPDLMDKYGEMYGKGSSAAMSVPGQLETLPYLGKALAPTTGTSKMAIVGKLLAREGGAMALGGGAMAANSQWFNHVLDQAVAEQNKRYKDAGKPELTKEAVDQFKQDAFQSFLDTGTLVGIVRAPKTAMNLGADILARNANEKMKLDDVLHTVDNAIPIEESHTELGTTHVSSHFDTQAYRDSLLVEPDAKGKENQLMAFARELDNNAQTDPARNIKIAEMMGVQHEGRSPMDLVQVLQAQAGLISKEGPLFDKTGNLVALRPVMLDKPTKFQANMGDGLMTVLQSFFPEGSHLTDLQKFAESFRDTPQAMMEHLNRKVQDPLTGEMKYANEPQRQMFIENQDAILAQLKQPPPLDPITKIRREAMANVLGAKVAETMIIPGVSEAKVRELTTRPMYAKYMTHLEGLTRKTVREAGLLRSLKENRIDAALSDSALLHKLTPEERMEISPATVQPNRTFLSWLKDKVYPLQPLMVDMAKKLNDPAIMDFYYTSMKAHALMHNILNIVGTYFDHHYGKLPKELKREGLKERFDEMTDWLSQDVYQRKVIEKELGLKNATPEMLADRVIRAGSSLKQSELIQHAQTIVTAKKKIFDYWLAQGMIPPEKARKNYSPIIRLYGKETSEGRTAKRLDEWLWDKRNDRVIRDALGEWKEIENIPREHQDFLDFTQTIRRKVLKDSSFVAGKSKASHEMERGLVDLDNISSLADLADLADSAFMHQVSHITDPREQVGLYTSRMARRYAFGPLVYETQAMLDRLGSRTDVSVQDKMMAIRQIHSMMEQMVGLPDASTLQWKDRRIPKNMAAIYELNKKVLPEMQKHPLLQKYLGDPKYTNLAQVSNVLMNGVYSYGIGLPHNPSMPLRNIITQSLPMAVSLFGTIAHAKGMIALFKDPSVIKELLPMSLRPARYYMDPMELAGKTTMGKSYNMAVQASMYAFSLGDLLGVWGTASTALLRWRELEKIANTAGGMDKLSPTQIMDTLIVRGASKRMPSALDVVSKDDSPGSKAFWNGVTDPNIMKVVIGKIKRGDAKGAKDAFIRYSADVPNFVYGPGGTNQHWRGPLPRMMLVFQSWVPNNFAWMEKTMMRGAHQAVTGNGGLLFWRWMQAVTWQYALAMAYVHMGGDKKIIRNLSLWGQFPNDIPSGTVIGQFAMNIAKLANDTSAEMNAEVFGEDTTEYERRLQADRTALGKVLTPINLQY